MSTEVSKVTIPMDRVMHIEMTSVGHAWLYAASLLSGKPNVFVNFENLAALTGRTT